MSDLKEYVDLKTDEIKLKATQGLSVATGRVVTALLLVGLLVVVLALLAVVLITWISRWIGDLAMASSIVCGAFLLLLLVFFLLRKRLFRDSFVRVFIQIFYGDGKA